MASEVSFFLKALYEIYVENEILLKTVVYYKCIYNNKNVFMPTIGFIRKRASINLEYYHDIHSVFWHYIICEEV